MTKEELATKLNGCHYGLSDVDRSLIDEAKTHGLVIGYGSLNTVIQFEGATYEEGDDLLDCEKMYIDEHSQNTIKAYWKGLCQGEEGGNKDYFWSYETSFPVAHFRMAGRRTRINDEKYCEGIVFALKDLQANLIDLKWEFDEI